MEERKKGEQKEESEEMEKGRVDRKGKRKAEGLMTPLHHASRTMLL